MQILSQDAAVEEEGQVCHKYTSGETYSINNKDFVHYKTPITDHYELHLGHSFVN